MFFGGSFLSLFKYLATVGAIALITTVSQMILPVGKMKKTVKVVFQLILIVSLITPILGNSVDFDLGFTSSVIAVDDRAVNQINEERSNIIGETCEKALEKEGILGVKVRIIKSNDEDNFVIKKVIVNFDDLRITTENEHINITRKTVNLLCDLLSVNSEVIVIE